MLLVGAAGTALAAPPLSSIQDILYKADGTRFSGTLTIQWKNFQAPDTTPIATQNVNVAIVDGVLRVKLVPTIGASPGANYQVTYQSAGKFLFTEIWAVPSSTQALRVRDVRVSSGTVVGSPAVVGQLVQIGDIAGLEQELLLRPMRGAGFGLGRAATINSAGQIDVAQGNLSDCVRVDGSSGPCGNGGGIGGTLLQFIDQEVPSGLVNGANATFALAQSPSPASSLTLYRNGLLMRQNLDFTLASGTITFYTASVPQTGDNLLASYRAVGSPSGGSTPKAAEVLCAGAGLSTLSTASTTLGSCTIPANALAPGDQVKVEFNFTKTGAPVSGFSTEVRWGATSMLTRSFPAIEAAVNGSIDVAASNPPSFYFGHSAGVQSGSSTTAGDATESLGGGITVTWLGSLATSGTGNAVTLRSFRVLRYPTVTAP